MGKSKVKTVISHSMDIKLEQKELNHRGHGEHRERGRKREKDK